MAGKVKFYRGAQGTSLPTTTQDGAIFIIERLGSDGKGYGVGDIYVDMDQGKRLHIIPDNNFSIYNSDPSISGQTSKPGMLYVVMDENNNQVGVKIGDGQAYIGDLPTYDAILANTVQQHTTQLEQHTNQLEQHTNKLTTYQIAISDKVNAYLGDEYLELGENKINKDNNLKNGIDSETAAETLVLSREL